MVYVWLIVLSAAVAYLFYMVNTMMDSIETLQELEIEKLEKISSDLDDNAEKLEEINNKVRNLEYDRDSF